MLRTTGLPRRDSRLTRVCSARTTWEAVGMGSMVWWGVAAWPPRPTILIRIRSTEAQTRARAQPDGSGGQGVPEVEGEDGVDRRVVKDAVLDHRRRAGGHLLGGLEDELDVAR